MSATLMVTKNPALVVERKLPVWPWLVGALALIVTMVVALKRHS
jgi:hypothetical protein